MMQTGCLRQKEMQSVEVISVISPRVILRISAERAVLTVLDQIPLLLPARSERLGVVSGRGALAGKEERAWACLKLIAGRVPEDKSIAALKDI